MYALASAALAEKPTPALRALPLPWEEGEKGKEPYI